MFRQGDVLLVPADGPIPKSVTKIKRQKGLGLVLAAGEVTGHHHRIMDRGADLFVDPKTNERFLSVVGGLVRITPTAIEAGSLPNSVDVTDESGLVYRLTSAQATAMEIGKTSVLDGVTLRHEEHHAHVIAPGSYKLPAQREYQAPNIERRVLD